MCSMHAPSSNTHTHRSTTRNIKNCMDLLYSTLSHSQFANPWITVVHVSSIYISTTWILDRSPVNSSLSHWPEVLACATKHHGWGAGEDLHSEAFASMHSIFHGAMTAGFLPPGPTFWNHCLHSNTSIWNILFREYHVIQITLGETFHWFSHHDSPRLPP